MFITSTSTHKVFFYFAFIHDSISRSDCLTLSYLCLSSISSSSRRHPLEVIYPYWDLTRSRYLPPFRFSKARGDPLLFVLNFNFSLWDMYHLRYKWTMGVGVQAHNFSSSIIGVLGSILHLLKTITYSILPSLYSKRAFQDS